MALAKYKVMTFVLMGALISCIPATSSAEKNQSKVAQTNVEELKQRDAKQVSKEEALKNAELQADIMGVDFIEIPDFKYIKDEQAGIFSRKCFDIMIKASDEIEKSENSIMKHLWKNMGINDSLTCLVQNERVVIFIDTGLNEFDIAILSDANGTVIKKGYVLSVDKYLD